MPIVLEAEVKEAAIVYEYNEKNTSSSSKIGRAFGCSAPDADSFFTDLYAQDNVGPLLCNAHARRKFEAITNATKKKGLAHHAMSVYAKLYHIERRMKAEKEPSMRSRQ